MTRKAITPTNVKAPARVIANGPIFDGESLLQDHAVILQGDTVAEVIPRQQVPASLKTDYDLQGQYLVPGFIDLQVNGGGGALFNDSPDIETLRTIGEAHRHYGTTGFLPTLISTNYTVMRRAIAAVQQAIAEAVPGVLGIHLEGPFLNSQRKGVHDAQQFCAIDEEGFDIITSLNTGEKTGKTLITLAPELTSEAMIKRIAARGVIICAGHSAADYQQTRRALAAGVSGFTHLYNAMTALQSREPGMVGAALEDDKSWFGIIADGHHIHPAAFRIAVAAKRRGGALLVTDAMPSVGAGNKSFALDGETIHCVDGRCTNAAGTLAGSDLDMISAVNNAARFAGIDWLEAVRMASLYPAEALGLAHCLGRIKTGYRASFAALDAQRCITQTWIDGEHSPPPSG